MVDRPETVVTTQAKPSTLEAAVALYLQNLSKPDLTTQQEVGSLLRHFGRQFQLSQLTPRDVETYSNLITANTDSGPRRVKVLKEFFTYVVVQCELPVALASHVKPRRIGKVQGSENAKKQPKERSQLTPEGHAQLLERLSVLKEELVRTADDIKKAAADKDVRENAPLETARQQQGQLMAQVRSIEATLEGAQILSSSAPGIRTRVRQGTRVTMQEVGSGKEISYQLVDPQEVKPHEGKISTASPVGRALLDKLVGDEVSVASPRGTVRYRIARIE